MPACAACAGSRAPARSPPVATIQATRRCSPATSSPSRRALQARCRPSPCDRLSRPRTTTTAPPHPIAISGRCALPTTGDRRNGSHVRCRSVGGIGARLSPCGHVATITQPLVAHRQRHEVLAADGRAATKSLAPRAPLRRPRSIGFEPGGFLREFDHQFTCVAPLRLACRARAIRRCSRDPALSGLLPPSSAAPGSGCPQLPQGRCDGLSARSLTPPDKTAPRGARSRPPSAPARPP